MNDFKNLPAEQYVVKDISGELWREIFYLETNATYHIKSPKTLVIRKGGKTHRVVDCNGIAHCYIAPESGKTIIRWKSKPEVNF